MACSLTAAFWRPLIVPPGAPTGLLSDWWFCMLLGALVGWIGANVKLTLSRDFADDILLLVCLGYIRLLTFPPDPREYWYPEVVGGTACGAIAILLFSSHRNVLHFSPLRFIGRISYSVYLFH